ncbi:MAG TPA: GxxExxY protein [Desulfobacterales bacterium]|nr:GxxExxY protein [Desulfobacterales bacterium]
MRPAEEEQMDLNEITYKINGAVFEVMRVLGAGFLEKVYENALLIELRKRGLKAESQVPLKVSYKGEVVGEYVVDILVEDAVILELKAVEQIQKIHEAQLLNYLKATGVHVGLLINFKHPKAEIKRFVLNLPEGHDTNCGDRSSQQ